MLFKYILIIFLLFLAVIISLFDRYAAAKYMDGANKKLLLMSFFIVVVCIDIKKILVTP